MKTKIKFLKIIVMAATLIFGAAACNDDAGDNSGPLSGKYTNAALFSSITFSGNTFKAHFLGTHAATGSYTLSDNNVTLTYTWANPKLTIISIPAAGSQEVMRIIDANTLYDPIENVYWRKRT